MSDQLNLPFGVSIDSSNATYRILQKLGAGGTAETYLVLATSGQFYGQLFAMKLFRRLSKPDWQHSFLEEVAFLKSCSHPSVMRVYDEGLFQNQNPFVVAEYLPSTLADVLRTRPGMISKIAYSVQLLSALVYLSRPKYQ